MIHEDEPHNSIYNKEEIELKLDKIPKLEKKLIRLENELIIIKKRIKKIQEVRK